MGLTAAAVRQQSSSAVHSRHIKSSLCRVEWSVLQNPGRLGGERRNDPDPCCSFTQVFCWTAAVRTLKMLLRCSGSVLTTGACLRSSRTRPTRDRRRLASQTSPGAASRFIAASAFSSSLSSLRSGRKDCPVFTSTATAVTQPLTACATRLELSLTDALIHRRAPGPAPWERTRRIVSTFLSPSWLLLHHRCIPKSCPTQCLHGLNTMPARSFSTKMRVENGQRSTACAARRATAMRPPR